MCTTTHDLGEMLMKITTPLKRRMYRQEAIARRAQLKRARETKPTGDPFAGLTQAPAASHGHLCWLPDHEVYQTDSGDLYMALKSNAIDIDTGYRHGRWLCTMAHLDHYGPDVIFGPGCTWDGIKLSQVTMENTS